MSAHSLGSRFPSGFRFGTATAAPQVEGAATEDGRGPSVWDTFAGVPGRILDGSTPEVACDQYHRYEEDAELLQRLGARGYRMSLSWPRIQPTGRGRPNPAGLDYYDRLLDRLLAAGVEPMVTLHHWDLPQALEDEGGWLNRDTVERFAEYAAIAGERFADRVRHWVPISEPVVVATLGYGTGEHAPGQRLLFGCLPAAHHLLLAHGRAVTDLRAAGATSVGCANNHAPMWPASKDDADIGATKLFDAVWNGIYLEAMLLGRYPADLLPLFEDALVDGDMATIRQPLDFYGVNYYSPLRVGAADEGAIGPFRFVDIVGHPRTDSGWAVVPNALGDWLVTATARYGAALPPLVVTEIGASHGAEPDEHGVVDDQFRIAYLAAHLEVIADVIDAGADVRGCYVWSLLDSWEWDDGFVPRYGLVHVDHATGRRLPKRSFGWYRDVVLGHRAAHAR